MEVRKPVGNAASDGRISGEQFKRMYINLHTYIRPASLTNLPDMTSLAAAGRLQNAAINCTKVRKVGAAGIEVHNSVTA